MKGTVSLAAAVVLGASVVVLPPAVADEVETPPTPTVESLTLATPLVSDGEHLSIDWIANDGGYDISAVELTYRDFDWNVHTLTDGGEGPLTGTLSTLIDSSWASGKAWPLTLEIVDSQGVSRVYRATSRRTPMTDVSVNVYADDVHVGWDSPLDGDFFNDIAPIIREDLADVEPPRITSAAIQDQEVEPGDTVVIDWTGADDHEGIWWIGADVNAPNGQQLTAEHPYVEYLYGFPPTEGALEIPIPSDAEPGIYQVSLLQVGDGACNARHYAIRGEAAPSSAVAPSCGGFPDYDDFTEDELSIAPLVFTVGAPLPAMDVPSPPEDARVRWDDGEWTLRWSSSTAYVDGDEGYFIDWLYLADINGSRRGVWPETFMVIPDQYLIDGVNRVRLQSLNRFGRSGSVWLTFDPEPSRPVLRLTSRLRSDRQVAIQWDPPTSGDAVRRYMVVSRSGDRPVCDPDPAVWKVASVVRSRFIAGKGARDRTFGILARDAEGQFSECRSVYVP